MPGDPLREAGLRREVQCHGRRVGCRSTVAGEESSHDDFSANRFRDARGAQFHITFSAGVSMLTRDDTLERWKQRADDALYSAKHHGRARVEAA